jgi:hopanoid biosynthesis associated RND transporter like protein HpnN
MVVAIAAGVLTALRLEFMSDRSALVDQSLPWQQRYLDLKKRFPRWSDAVVVVAPRDAAAPRDRVKEDARVFFGALEARIAGDALLPGALVTIDAGSAPPGMVLLQPEAGVRRTVAELGRAAPAVGASSVSELLGLASLAGSGDEARAGVARVVAGVEEVARGESDSVLGVTNIPPEPLMVGESALAVGFVSMAGADGASTNGSVNATAPAVAALRAHIDAALVSSGMVGRLSVGVTGIPVLEADETAQSVRDGTVSSALSFGLIALLLVVVYRGVVVPIVALIALVVGVAWSFGWTTLAVGHLQVLSVVFVAMLLGLGVAVAIHVIARLELEHPDHDHLAGAVRQTFRGVGPGILTSTLTTAVAFGATAFTRFKGVAEMGIIAAGGIVLCTVSIMLMVPALLMLIPRPERILRSHDGGTSRPFWGALGVAKDRRPIVVLALGVVVLGIGLPIAAGVAYEPDLMELMPEGVESVRWERALTSAEGRTAWHAIAIAPDEATARRWISELRAKPEVESVGGAGDFLIGDADASARRAIVATLPDLSGRAAREAPTDAAALRTSLERIAGGGAGPAFGAEALASASAALGASDADLERVERVFAADQDRLAERIVAMRSAEVPAIKELPDGLRSLVGTTDDGLVLRVYPRTEPGESPLAGGRLGPFARAVLEVVPSATGPAIQIYESTRVILSAFRTATVLALGAIVVLLLIDFRSWKDAACALVPVAVATVLMLAVMRLAGVPLNFANTIVLPLMFGIGVDSGVHAVHRWRQQPHDAPAGLAGGTGRAITVTMLTTVAGFACMLVAEHRGIRSLGFVMSVGLVMVWAGAVFVLPPILRLRSRWRTAVASGRAAASADLAA